MESDDHPHEDELRRIMGPGGDESEGQAFHSRETGEIKIVNFGKEVWRGTLRLPQKRDHRSLVRMLVDAGFSDSHFRRNLARAIWDNPSVPSKPCGKSCSCSPKQREDFWHGRMNDDDGGCVWRFMLEWEDYSRVFSMLPDAWMVIPEHRVVVVAEVDVTHHPQPDKYLSVWWWLDCELPKRKCPLCEAGVAFVSRREAPISTEERSDELFLDA